MIPRDYDPSIQARRVRFRRLRHLSRRLFVVACHLADIVGHKVLLDLRIVESRLNERINFRPMREKRNNLRLNDVGRLDRVINGLGLEVIQIGANHKRVNRMLVD